MATETLLVVGAGQMGSGIAQVAAQAGLSVTLIDVAPALLDKARERIRASVEKLAGKGLVPEGQVPAILGRVQTATSPTGVAADFAIEAVTENERVKRDVLKALDQVVRPGGIIASNTSSLSITALAGAVSRPQQFLGLHFFNPPLLMALVEVVRGDRTSPETLEAGLQFARDLGKTPVACKDTPAFIVNRVARPFYGEALRLLGENAADPATIDGLMKSAGFKMGPFELMDFIGLDVNFAVTQSVYNAFFHEPRYRPHPIQQKMVEAGLLGRKTRRGFYEYADE